MLLQVWEKAHPWDTALLGLYFLSRKKNVIVENEDVTYSSELAFLLFCGSLKAICNLKPGVHLPCASDILIDTSPNKLVNSSPY